MKIVFCIIIMLFSLDMAIKAYRSWNDLSDDEKSRMTAEEIRIYERGYFQGKITMGYCFGSFIVFIISILYLVFNL